MIRYVDTFKDQFGVEAICRTMRATESGFLTARGYRAAKTRPPSARTLSDCLARKWIVSMPRTTASTGAENACADATSGMGTWP